MKMALIIVTSLASLGMFVLGVKAFFHAVRPLRPGESAKVTFAGIPARGWGGAVSALIWAVAGAGVLLSLWLR